MDRNAHNAHDRRGIGTVAAPVLIGQIKRKLYLVRNGVGFGILVLKTAPVVFRGVAHTALCIFRAFQDAAVEPDDPVGYQYGLIQFIVGETVPLVRAVLFIVLWIERAVGAKSGVKPRLLHRLPVVGIPLFKDHYLNSVNGIGYRVFITDDCRPRLGPFDHVRLARTLAVAVVHEHKAVLVVLFSVMRIIHAAQTRHDLVERIVGALHLVHVISGDLPTSGNGSEGKNRERRQHSNEHRRQKHFYHGERFIHRSFSRT